eukprot:7919899-Pyramimonas_sp.AAC.1
MLHHLLGAICVAPAAWCQVCGVGYVRGASCVPSGRPGGAHGRALDEKPRHSPPARGTGGAPTSGHQATTSASAAFHGPDISNNRFQNYPSVG